MYGGPSATGQTKGKGQLKLRYKQCGSESGARRTLAEDVERELDDEQQDTAAGREPEHFRHEAFVQRRRALFPEDRHQSGRPRRKCKQS